MYKLNNQEVKVCNRLARRLRVDNWFYADNYGVIHNMETPGWRRAYDTVEAIEVLIESMIGEDVDSYLEASDKKVFNSLVDKLHISYC